MLCRALAIGDVGHCNPFTPYRDPAGVSLRISRLLLLDGSDPEGGCLRPGGLERARSPRTITLVQPLATQGRAR